MRDHNEDALVERPETGLWAVADGAGGHQSGAVASATVAEALAAIPGGLGASEMIAQVRQAVSGAHDTLLGEAARRGPDAAISRPRSPCC